MAQNAYIHIPFCKSKCKYCSFVSFTSLELKNEYLAALTEEIKNYYKNEKLDTLYFGGGTPSILTINEIDNIIKLFNISEFAETTIELNPENITYDYLKGLKDTGINRLSFGCQTFNYNILGIIGRRHCAKDVKNALLNAQKAGFKNISLDFIYGLPKQNIDDFSKDLYQAVELGVKHISLYGLKIDEGCYFYNNYPENLPDEDVQADMYIKAVEVMENNGFEHYEISNFAQKGFESRHNLNYWDNNTYYGFGISAHGYIDGIRYSNSNNIKEYIKNPYKRKTSHNLSLQEQLEEEIFLGFRKMEGINIEKINKKFNINFKKKYGKILDKYLSCQYLLETNTGFKLSTNGILISNFILAEFLE